MDSPEYDLSANHVRHDRIVEFFGGGGNRFPAEKHVRTISVTNGDELVAWHVDADCLARLHLHRWPAPHHIADDARSLHNDRERHVIADYDCLGLDTGRGQDKYHQRNCLTPVRKSQQCQVGTGGM